MQVKDRYSARLIFAPIRRGGKRQSSAVIPFAEPILCVKAIGGPFDFNIEVVPVEGAE
jgi:hypothetical protein